MTDAGRPRVPGERGWARWIGRVLAHGVWATDVAGTEHVPLDGPVLFAANHTGVVDGPLMFGAAPRAMHILVKEEMFAGPIGWLLHGSGQIPVDREGGRAALVASLGVLQRGGAVGIFPEGNRGRGDAAAARGGVAWLALRSGAPVVPVAVLGTRRTGEGVNHIPGLRRRLVVEFGPPVDVVRADGASGRTALDQANATLRDALSAVVAAATRRTGIELPTDDPNRERTVRRPEA